MGKQSPRPSGNHRANISNTNKGPKETNISWDKRRKIAASK